MKPPMNETPKLSNGIGNTIEYNCYYQKRGGA